MAIQPTQPVAVASEDGVVFNISVAESTLAGRYTQEQLAAAFESVQDEDHWKNPVDAWIPADADVDLVRAAVEHFTATEATVVADYDLESNPPVLTGHHVTAPGYWAGPAA